MSQSARLADQIKRAFAGDAWHGDSVLELLADVNAARASARPIKNAHSIWEILLHVSAWDNATIVRAGGQPTQPTGDENFPPVKDTSEAAWRRTVEAVKKKHEELVQTVAAFPDTRLDEIVPGKKPSYYTYYYLFSGIVQHELYHAGQIALLKKAQGL